MLMSIIYMIVGIIKLKSLLKRCLVEDSFDEIEVFEYKKRNYNKTKFVAEKAKSLATLKKSQLEKNLINLESGLSKSKNVDLDLALIEATKIAISRA